MLLTETVNLLSEWLQIDYFLLISWLIYQVEVELDPQLSLGLDNCTTFVEFQFKKKTRTRIPYWRHNNAGWRLSTGWFFFGLKLFVHLQHILNCIHPAETCVKQRHLHCKANLTLWLCWGTPSREAALNEKCRLQRATPVCRPPGLSDFYSSQAIGRALMYGGRILAFIVVFEWIHREIGSLESPSERKKNAFSASQVSVFWGKWLHRFNQARLNSRDGPSGLSFYRCFHLHFPISGCICMLSEWN